MRLGLIGGGNMAYAIAQGALRGGVCAAADVAVSEPSADRRALFETAGARAVWDNAAVAGESDLLVLAVKPQVMDAALASIRGAIDPARTLVVSIAAGRRIAQIEHGLPPGTRVVRVMPNTPLLAGAGMSVLAPGTRAAPDDLRRVRALFEAGGRVIELPEEHFDAVTAVSGSGPAYFFLLAEVLAAGGRDVGLPAEAAELLARQTLIGAARLLEQSGAPAETLRRQVTSPGGTTAAALATLEAGGFAALIASAVAAAMARGRELGQIG